MIDLILDKIVSNKISSVEVADALGKSGVIPGINALNNGKYAASKVFYVPTWSSSNWPLHQKIQSAPKDSIVFIDVFDCDSRAVLGDLVAKQLLVYQKVSAIIVNGFVRDAHRLVKEDYPIWTKGVTPLGCFNRDVIADNSIKKSIQSRFDMFANSILVADDSGCTLIQGSQINNILLQALDFIELQEDIWYYCLIHLR